MSQDSKSLKTKKRKNIEEIKEKLKKSLFFKTRIAGWWTVILAGVLVIIGLYLFITYFNKYNHSINDKAFWFRVFLIPSISLAIVSIVPLVFGIFVLKRKKWAWYAVIVMLSIMIFITIIVTLIGKIVWNLNRTVSLIFIAAELIPILLFYIDRKKFFFEITK